MPLQRARNYTSVFLALTMLVSSAASAAPAPAPNQIDPLVALSLSGTAGSRAAVCGPGCSEGSMAAVSAGSTATAAAVAAQDPYDATPRGSMMPLWVSLAVVLAGWAWIILDNDDEDDDEVEVPVSPA